MSGFQIFEHFNSKKWLYTTNLLGILVLPSLGLVLFIFKCVLDSQIFRPLAICYSIFTVFLLFWFLIRVRNKHSLLKLLRTALRSRYIQHLLAFCIKVELFIKSPFVIVKVVLICFCSVLSYCVLNSLSTNCFGFLVKDYSRFIYHCFSTFSFDSGEPFLMRTG